MPAFFVRFKGMLNRQERERLEAAGIAIERKESSLQIGIVKTGRLIYTVRVEAASEDEALAMVREALVPDTSNFSSWESDPA
ncbi:MAG TPA: hypothetical protein VLI94_01345 [Solirubrobacterales bacterium]|nr:hypothetical protein [Solirubrobacterales bacterium]